VNWQHRDLIVGNEKGIHSRVATRLAGISAEFGVILQISKGEEIVDCSSILDVLALALVQGTVIGLHAGGEKAGAALLAAQTVVTLQDDA
jgi:phosphocarrier protein HPr